ncbi:FtsB family cell division protein [Compostibacter hankyongensis]|uniref:Septum formation initiator family protein n=1 Tax=Compostibacter hankyongensis TaxID=1007089 RepID=A0ABP8FES8_9BACT
MRKFARLLRNKYIIATVAFAVWMIFFDRNDLITQVRYRAQLYELQQKKDYLLNEISQTEKERQELLSSPEKQEKFAREKYFMKKDGEDLFVITAAPQEEDKK